MATTKISPRFSFAGWDPIDFLRGRKRMIVTVIGAIAGYVTTQNPALAAICAAGADLLYAIIDFYVSPVELKQ